MNSAHCNEKNVTDRVNVHAQTYRKNLRVKSKAIYSTSFDPTPHNLFGIVQ